MSQNTLEEAWNDSYSADLRQRLWPHEPNPAVELASRHFSKNATILDLPCGDGKNVFRLSTIGPVIAADTSSRALAHCQAAVRGKTKQPVVIMEADAFNTPFGDETIESLFCCDLLGHLPDPERALAEVHRICSPTGRAVVTIFSGNDSAIQDSNMKPTGDGAYWFRDTWFFRFYTELEARNLVLNAGFNILEMVELTWWEDPHPGYREYKHLHASWCIAISKR